MRPRSFLALLLLAPLLAFAEDGEGRVRLDPPGPFVVGSFCTLKFTFTVGPSGIEPGGGIAIRIPGAFARVFAPPQVDDPRGPGFVTASCSRPRARIRLSVRRYRWPVWIERFEIRAAVEGEPLKPGDKIVVVFGDKRFGGPGARVRRLIQAFDVPIPVASDVDGDGKFADLAEFPRIDVVGTDAVGLDCYAPSMAVLGKPVEVTVVARDPYGNVAPNFSGTLSIECSDRRASFPKVIHLRPAGRGIATFKATFRTPGFHWFTVEPPFAGPPLVIERKKFKPLPEGLRPEFDPDFKPVLLRVEISAPEARPGDTIGLTFVWRNDGTKPGRSDADYRVFTHLGTRRGRAMANWDHKFPIPMNEWRPGQVVRYTRAVKIPDDAPEGRHQLRVGIYDVASWRRGENVRLCAYEVTFYRVSKKAPPHRFVLSTVSNPIWVVGREPKLKLYWGDIHGHTENSDGTGTIEHYYWYARNVSRLDFAAVTDHVSAATPKEVWRKFQEGARRFYEPGKFVTFLACEWSTAWWGDRNIYFLRDDEENPVPRGDVSALWRNLDGKRAIVIPHHPAYPIGLRGADWRCHNPKFERLVEIASMHGISEFFGNPGECGSKNMGPAAPGGFVRDALGRGLKLGIIASSDDHSGRPGSSQWGKWGDGRSSPLAAVWAPKLAREAVFDALYNRRCYGTTGARMIVVFKMDGHWMGEEYATDRPPRAYALVVGRKPLKVVQIVKNGRVAFEKRGEGRKVVEFTWVDENFAEPRSYYYLRAEQVDGEIAWSSPVWVESLRPFPDISVRVGRAFEPSSLRPGMEVEIPVVIENKGGAPSGEVVVEVSHGPRSRSWPHFERPRWKAGLLTMPRTGVQIWRWPVDEGRVNVFIRWADREGRGPFEGIVKVFGCKAYVARPYHFEPGDRFRDDGKGTCEFESRADDPLGDGINLTLDIRPDREARVWLDVRHAGRRMPSEVWLGQSAVGKLPFEFPVSLYRPKALIGRAKISSLKPGERRVLRFGWRVPGAFVKWPLLVVAKCKVDKNYSDNSLELPLPISSPEAALPSELDGWKRAGKIWTFGPENLHEAVDGAAQEFVDYDFRRLAMAEYEDSTGRRAMVSVFDMAEPLNAFGIYAKGSEPGTRALDVGAGGSFSMGVLAFWQGRFFVRIEAEGWEPERAGELLRIAEGLSSLLPRAERPPFLSVLPSDGRVEGSLAYYRRNAFGIEGLERVVAAEYRLDGRRFWLFAAEYPSEREASFALSKIARFGKGLRAKGAEVSVRVPFYGRLDAFRLGRFLYGSLGEGAPREMISCLRERILVTVMGARTNQRRR